MGKKNLANPSCCFMPGCKTGYPSTVKLNKILRKKNPALFSVKNSEELKKWRDAIQRIDKEMKIGDKVCELHFTEDMIIKQHEIILRDGTVWKMDRMRFSLKKGAVPTIFPNLQNNRGKKQSKRELSSNETSQLPESTLNECTMTVNDNDPKSVEKIKNDNSENIFRSKRKYGKISLDDIPHLGTDPLCRQSSVTCSINTNTESILDECSKNSDVTIYHDDPKTENEATESENSASIKIVLCETLRTFTYATLINSLELLSKPNLLWGIASHDEFIMCANWDKDGTLMKRVIIDCDLKVKVFFKNKAIDFEDVKINCLTDLSTILLEIDRYGICAYVNDMERMGCDGYVLPKSLNWCEYCQLVGNWEIDRNKKLSWLSKSRNFSKHQALYEKIRALNKKNVLLQQQLNKLIKVKAVWKLSTNTNQNTIKS